MAKAKTKKPVIEEEEENEVLETPEVAEPVAAAAPVRRVDNGMILDMEGYGAEVASALIVNGLRAYLSVVNKGVNVVATNRAHTAFIPVKIEASNAGLDVRRDDAKPLVEAQGVLAFLYEEGEERTSFYLPVSEYLEMAEDRGESGLRLDVEEHGKWLEKYEGHAGIKRVFARLLS
ncbi:unnamed protein product [Gemmata massiliana]|uniref:Uncharacterized protein n=1 Tax=Gemmata massiliana TaxID=1210884 RepID=A0A6P2CY26_9BACT|nr:hypothetical protein [Gemmata massiliana]VTR93803.1 unnamed protein product [Gemmata massiliana]